MAVEPSAEISLAPPNVQPFGFSDPDRVAPKMGEFVSGAISGFSVHLFDFIAPGGPSHLLPGRPMEQTQPLSFPSGSSLTIALMGVNAIFADDNVVHLRERELGQFRVWTGFRAPNLLVCEVRLTAQAMDQAVRIQVQAIALFFS
jgi:hypothetical protein